MCVCVFVFATLFSSVYTRVCVCVLVGVIVLITLTPALGAGTTVQGVELAL